MSLKEIALRFSCFLNIYELVTAANCAMPMSRSMRVTALLTRSFYFGHEYFTYRLIILRS